MITGIVAGSLPLIEKLDIPSLQRYAQRYMGTLTIESGARPSRPLSVGPDPDHFLFFAHVSEELLTWCPTCRRPEGLLQRVGLDSSHYERRINTLSGGERMKLCLALSLSREYGCYLLNGVIPWLDRRGRELLKARIGEIKRRASVVFFEQEVGPILDIVDRVFELAGRTTHEITKEAIQSSDRSAPTPNTVTCTGPRQKTLSLRGLTFYDYPDSESNRSRPILRDVSLDLYDSTLYVLMGDNGSGKSTLAKLIFGTLEPNEGDVYIMDTRVRDMARNDICRIIAYVSQFPEQQCIYHRTADYHRRAERAKNNLAMQLIEKWIPAGDQPIAYLSPFQMRTLMLAGQLTLDTKLVIIDEPTWGASRDDQEALFVLLGELCGEKHCSILMITHDERLVSSLPGAELLLLEDQRIESQGHGGSTIHG
jgi:energy-coupling factor transporter ATP-binding protein EcfA2